MVYVTQNAAGRGKARDEGMQRGMRKKVVSAWTDVSKQREGRARSKKRVATLVEKWPRRCPDGTVTDARRRNGGTTQTRGVSGKPRVKEASVGTTRALTRCPRGAEI